MIRPKLLHTGDWHLGATLSSHSLLPYQLEIIDEIVELALREKVTAFLIAGDFFHQRLSFRKGSEIAAVVARRLTPLAQAGIPIIIEAGNHDPPEFLRMKASLMNLVTAGSAPASHQPLVIVQDPTIMRVGGMQFVFLPYPAREILAAERKHSFESEKDPILERNMAVTEMLRQILHQMVDSPRFKPNVPSVLVGHFTMANAHIPGLGEQEPGGFQHDYIRDFVFPASAVPNRFVYGAFGHIHNRHDLHTTKTGRMPFPSSYCGDPWRLNMGERGDEKSVTIVEVLPDNSVDVRVELLTQIPMERLDIKLDDLERLEAEKEKYRDAFVKVVLEHDGSVPQSTLYQRIGKLFRKHVGIELKGPSLVVQGRETRLAEAHGLTDPKEGDVTWNIGDHPGTIRAYLTEVLKDHPDAKGIIERGVELAREFEPVFYGAPEDDFTGKVPGPSPEDLINAKSEFDTSGDLPDWFRERYPLITPEEFARTTREEKEKVA